VVILVVVVVVAVMYLSGLVKKSKKAPRPKMTLYESLQFLCHSRYLGYMSILVLGKEDELYEHAWLVMVV